MKLPAHHQNIHVYRTCSNVNPIINAFQTILCAIMIMTARTVVMRGATAPSLNVSLNISAAEMDVASIAFGNAVRLTQSGGTAVLQVAHTNLHIHYIIFDSVIPIELKNSS